MDEAVCREETRDPSRGRTEIVPDTFRNRREKSAGSQNMDPCSRSTRGDFP
ncbi:hypothetical protein B005_4768 [Nocardiopsis alba ATCC BAA-2165]|uniref:Uncharacterized protein n=1 Tax=Nocardiopsis alba (strain ATCC BAA-2165 / BE74) TaxID=1205910 RepID=J7KZ20_NOCAA|nr:hypothetical protein B005_4768 [Nocardiopsis alba ATCC BAA-2165]